MSDWLKIRVHETDVARWKAVAGYRGLSQWVRELCNAEVRRVEERNGPVRTDSGPQEPFSGPPPPPARVLPGPEVAVTSRPTCRHGLENCRICQVGLWAPERSV